MTELSHQHRLQSLKLSEIASRNGVSLDAVSAIFDGMRRSGGRMVQFSHPELGGMGQWSSGMVMIGEMSNSALKVKVQGLCQELSQLAVEKSMEPVESMEPMKPMAPMEPMKPFKPFENIQWWPTSLGTPSSVGSQNQNRYAYFPETNRLAIEHNGKVTIFDTGKHKINGASQAQGDSDSLSFDSQLGRVPLSDLKEVEIP